MKKRNLKKISIIICLVLVVIITGCEKKKVTQLTSAIKNTSISQKKVNSYRAKLSVRSDSIEENYIVYNDSNKSYEINFIDNEGYETAKIENGNTTVFDKENNELNVKLKYDYTDTDLFLVGLDEVGETNYKEELIGKDTYKVYDFSVSSKTMNKILKPFNLSVEESGNCKVYINPDNQVYLIIYNFNNISASVSYTMIK